MNRGKKVIFITLIILGLIGIIIGVLLLFKKDDNKEVVDSKYSTKSINVMKEYNIYEKIINKEYSKTVEAMLTEKTFKDEYLEEYYNIEYNDMVGFTVVVNKLLEKEYNSEEINYIIKNYKDDLNILLNMEYLVIKIW